MKGCCSDPEGMGSDRCRSEESCGKPLCAACFRYSMSLQRLRHQRSIEYPIHRVVPTPKQGQLLGSMLGGSLLELVAWDSRKPASGRWHPCFETSLCRWKLSFRSEKRLSDHGSVNCRATMQHGMGAVLLEGRRPD